MDIAELIERAKKAAGSQLAVGEKIGRPHSRISEWKAGRRKPDAADIMLLAEVAGLPPLETLAEIESQLDAERSSVWQRALSSLRTAGAGTVLAILVLVGLCGPPDHAQAAVRYSDSALPSHGRGHWFDPSTAHQRIEFKGLRLTTQALFVLAPGIRCPPISTGGIPPTRIRYFELDQQARCSCRRLHVTCRISMPARQTR